MAALQKVSPPRTCEGDLIGRRVFADVVKDIKTRSPQMTQVGPKSNDEQPYQRKERETETHRRRPGKTGPEGCSHELRSACSHQEQRRQEGLSPGAFGGSAALRHLGSRISGLRDHESTQFYSLKPPQYVALATAAPGHS